MSNKQAEAVRNGQQVAAIFEAAAKQEVPAFRDAVEGYAKEHGVDAASVMASCKDANKRTALHFAAYSGKVAICDHILDAAPGLVDIEDDAGETPLHLAAGSGHLPVVARLLERGADAGKQSKSGLAPIHRSVGHSSVMPGVTEKLIRLLATRSPESINYNGATGTPLHWCVTHGGEADVQALLAAGADPTIADPGEGTTALLMAAAMENEKVAVLICQAVSSLPPSRKDDVLKCLNAALPQGGYTALHIASDTGLTRLVGQLLALGADVHKTTDDGSTALQLAGAARRAEVVECIWAAHPSTKPPGISTAADYIQALQSRSSAAGKSSNGGDGSDKTKEADEERERGNADFKARRYEDALARYSKAVALNGQDIRNYLNRAACHLALGAAAEALADAAAAKAINARDPKVFYREGCAHMLRKDYAEAAGAFFDGLALAPGNSDLRESYQHAFAKAKAEAEAKAKADPDKR